jgi:hypothetical protein
VFLAIEPEPVAIDTVTESNTANPATPRR